MKEKTPFDVLKEALVGKEIKVFKAFYDTKHPDRFNLMSIKPTHVEKVEETTTVILDVVAQDYGDEGIGLKLILTGNIPVLIELTDTLIFC